MIISNINKFTNGWLIGDFEPSLVKTPYFEIANHIYKQNDKSNPHVHRIAIEYNYIVSGKLFASGKELGPGDIFIYEPGDVSEVEFLEDTNLIIIKIPSIPNDKYPVS